MKINHFPDVQHKKDSHRTNNSASIMVIGISEPKSNLLESEK